MSTFPDRNAARHPIQRLLATLAGTALVATGLVTGGALSASAAPAASGSVIADQTQTVFEPGRYIVTLAENAAATYEGGIRGLAKTKPEEGNQLNARRQVVETYADYLEHKQQAIAATVGASVDYSYTLALNGFSTTLSAEQAVKLSRNKNVVSLQKDELQHLTAAVPSTDFLGLSGPNGVWNATGGVESAGDGVVLGVIDSGIAPENPSFAGEALGTDAGAEPYYSARGVTSFAKSDGSTFAGVCQTGVQFNLDDCSTKIIGARYFVKGFGADNIATTEQGEYLSPRGESHGSHTASTAIGNANVDASVGGQDFGHISGVAPAGKVAAYKVCWSGATPDDDGCASSDILAAIDAAVDDGVDVINFSVGGGAATSTVSPTDLAFLGAAAAGIFVSASAGNSGPGSSTLDHASPWITTVAASNIPTWEATVELGNGKAYVGASATVDRTEDAEPVSGPLVTATAVALADQPTPNLCIADSLDPELADGKIVVCERGVSDRVAKSAEVKRVGGIGMVLINPEPSSLDLDRHSVPTVHLDARFHDQVMDYASMEDATATLVPGNQTDFVAPTPEVAGFSSRGPALADGSDILKPDITAPGVAILAAGSNAEDADPTWEFESGTSMSAPHIAGLAVLFLGEYPNATPAAIKSVMMTTAYNTVDGNGDPVTDPFVQGAGQVDPTNFFAPGLLYLNGIDDWLSFIEGTGNDVIDPAVLPIDPSNLNLASIAIGELTAPETITRTVTSTQAGTFHATVNGLAGITTTVEPSTLVFNNSGESQSYTVTFTRTDAPLDEFATGSLDWTSGDVVVHSPIAVQPVTLVAPANAAGIGVSGSVDLSVTPGGAGDIPLGTTGLTPGTLQADPTGEETDHSGSGETGTSFEYTVEVPKGTSYARFDLDSADDTADLDLTVYLLGDDGEPVAGYQSATASADERVNIREPEAGTYQVYVDIFSAATATVFDLKTYAVAPGGAPLTLTPAVIAAVQGVPATVTASWMDLAPFTSYLGEIRYGDTGVSTLLEVVTAEGATPGAPGNTAPPTVSGEPLVGKTLTASPGNWDAENLTFGYQWQADGADISGATGQTYKVRSTDQGKAISVNVTATATGGAASTATSDALTVKFSSRTSLSVRPVVYFSWQRATASITVSTAEKDAPTGKVVVTVNGNVKGETAVTADANGKVSFKLPKLSSGLYHVQAKFVPDSDSVVGSTSARKLIVVVF